MRKTLQNCLTAFCFYDIIIKLVYSANGVSTTKIKRKNQDRRKYHEKNLSTQKETDEQSTRFP